VGSNPTPRAYLGGLYKSHKNKVGKVSSKRKTDLAYRQQISNSEEEEKVKETDLSYRQINFITKTCSKLYFNKILKKLAEKNSENVNIICKYIIAEETELNIKNFTEGSRIKVLVWLSNFHNDTKSFKLMTKQIFLIILIV
jgi:predicted DNA-binding ribbon-helix-helix protein